MEFYKKFEKEIEKYLEKEMEKQIMDSLGSFDTGKRPIAVNRANANPCSEVRLPYQGHPARAVNQLQPVSGGIDIDMSCLPYTRVSGGTFLPPDRNGMAYPSFPEYGRLPSAQPCRLGGISMEVVRNSRILPEIERVIYNNPATIVYWKDGTKTVVKAYDETFDKEKGLTMAIAKKVLGNEGNYFNEIKRWTNEK